MRHVLIIATLVAAPVAAHAVDLGPAGLIDLQQVSSGRSVLPEPPSLQASPDVLRQDPRVSASSDHAASMTVSGTGSMTMAGSSTQGRTSGIGGGGSGLGSAIGAAGPMVGFTAGMVTAK